MPGSVLTFRPTTARVVDERSVLAGARSLLDRWLADELPAHAYAWVREQRTLIAAAPDPRAMEALLARALGLAPRRVGRSDLALGAAALAEADALRAGFDPTGWSVDQAARVLFVLDSAAAPTSGVFVDRLRALLATADLHESIALYRGVPLYPGQAQIEPVARTAVRSGMQPIYEAMAHRNPYPREWFDDAAWTQMVVKSFFNGAALWPIQGLEARATPELAAVLVDLARERRAAGRPVSPELWRCVVLHADEAAREALHDALRHGIAAERIGVLIALRAVPALWARHLEAAAADLAVVAAGLTWETGA